MFQSSIVARCFLLIYSRVLSLYEVSFFKRVISGFSGFCAEVWKSSILHRILCGNFSGDAIFANSLTGEIAHAGTATLNSLHRKLMPLAKTSLLRHVLNLKLTEACVYATIFLVPLFPTKIILALCALTCTAFFAQLLFTDRYRISFELADFFVAMFGVVLLYSVPLSYIPRSSSLMALIYLLFLLFYFVCRNVIRTKKQLHLAVALLVASGAIVAAIGVAQYHFGFTLDVESWIDTKMFETNQFRITSTLDNPNVLGEYFLLVIPLSFSMLYFAKNDESKLFIFLATAVMVVAILLTLSRGAWLGLICGMAVFAMMRDKRLIALALVAVAFIPVISPSILERFLSIGNMNDSSTAYRVSIWMASVLLLADFWPVGIGLSSMVFMLVYQKYAFSASYALHSHNLYLQIAVELGIWGLIIFFVILFLFFRNAFKASTPLSAALCAGMIGFMVQSMTDYAWYNYRMVVLFWILIALCVVCGVLARGEERELVVVDG